MLGTSVVIVLTTETRYVCKITPSQEQTVFLAEMTSGLTVNWR